MAKAMVALANITLGSAASSVTFSSLPSVGTYRDLVIVANTRHASATAPYNQFRMRFNSDSGSNYSLVRMLGDGGSTESSSYTSVELAWFFDAPSGASNFSSFRGTIYDYAQTDKHKSVLARLDDVSINTQASVARWASTAAITSLVLYPATDTWVAGSTFALYGVA